MSSLLNLTVKQVKDLCSNGSVDSNEVENETVVPRHTIQLAKHDEICQIIFT